MYQTVNTGCLKNAQSGYVIVILRQMITKKVIHNCNLKKNVYILLNT